MLQTFGVGMLVTQTPEGRLRGRPMALAGDEADGTLWSVTDRNSTKVDELAWENRVAVTTQSGAKDPSLSGTAQAVTDRERVARLWRPDFKAWFPGGKDDPNLIVLRVDGIEGESWDDSGAGGLEYPGRGGPGTRHGARPKADHPTIHGEVTV